MNTGRKRLVLISDWKDLDSVTAIGQGLQEAYTKLGKLFLFQFVEVQDHTRRAPLAYDYAELFESCQRHPPIAVIVTNGAILRSYFFRLLLMVLNGKGCSFYFHIYGDYLRQAEHWLSLEGLLRNQRLIFVVPSHAYERVIRKTLVHPGQVVTIPFSYQSDDLGLEQVDSYPRSEALTFLYAGRLSAQKNVRTVIFLLEELQQKLRRPVELWLAGGFDDFEPQLTGAHILGTQFDDLSCPTDISIIRLGHLPRARLKPLFEAADFYISLSTFHDDDFCLAAVEALCAGIPAVLSCWGGHLDLVQLFPDRCSGISVSEAGQLTDPNAALAQIHDFVTSPIIRDAGKNPSDYFSPARIGPLIEAQLRALPPSFAGFSPTFHSLAGEMARQVRGEASTELYKSFQGQADGLD